MSTLLLSLFGAAGRDVPCRLPFFRCKEYACLLSEVLLKSAGWGYSSTPTSLLRAYHLHSEVYPLPQLPLHHLVYVGLLKRQENEWGLSKGSLRCRMVISTWERRYEILLLFGNIMDVVEGTHTPK